MPSTGALRPGPVGNEPPTTTYVTTIPVSIVVEAAGINADVETLNIENGRLADPTGPWVVSWYRQSGQLGEPGNVLMAGHVDFWGVGPCLFYNVRDLVEGDQILLTDSRAVAEPEHVVTVLVAAGCPPYRLVVEEDDLETFFLRVVGA